MKTRRTKLLLTIVFVFLVLLLSACQLNFITTIEKNGSGTYVQEIGFQGDEAAMAGLSAGDENFCASQNEEMPPNTSVRQETRNETETWCIYETSFDSLDGLKSVYGTTDIRINNISTVDGKMTYDISFDLSGDSSAPTGAEVYWIVTLPGKIIETNAAHQDDNTLTWTLRGGETNNIRAVSEMGGFNLGDNPILYALGGVAGLCLCCVVPLGIGGAAFFVLRRKNASTSEEPVS